MQHKTKTLFNLLKDRDIPDAARHVNTLNDMTKIVEEYRLELEQLNREEQLFGFEQSQFPMMQQILTIKDPYDKLWSTFYNFQQKENQWLKGF